MADPNKRLTHNEAGDFYVDESCIDCDTCRWLAPSTFGRREEQASVVKQPGDAPETTRALMALLRRLVLLRIQQAVICGDSRTVVCQVRGQVNTRATNRFRKVIFTARQLLDDHPGWALKWIPRAENGLLTSGVACSAPSLTTCGLPSAKV